MKISSILKKRNSFCLFVHTSPDADCVSCGLSMAYALLKSGRKAEVFTDDKDAFLSIQQRLSVLLKDNALGDIKILQSLSESELLDSNPALFLLDCSEFKRIGALFDDIKSHFDGDYISSNLFIIDHHINPDVSARAVYIDDKCSSASELCYRVLTKSYRRMKNDWVLSQVCFFGMAADTGFFRYLRTGERSAETLMLASHLTSVGAKPNMTSAFLYPKNNIGYNIYFAHLLENTEYIATPETTIALIKDTKEDFERFGKEKRPTGALFDMLLGTEGVGVVIFLKRTADDAFTECSVRVSALSAFKANEFCAQFAGGGHEKAAGFRTQMAFDDVEKKIRQII